ncbi:cytochrome P450 [Gordonia metallireducens]|uniref:cytochrome P450 n=1 Tax=Gordonia metallireducens TaxID=2897779 RepID=UPI001E46CCC9|nr:cytochrome P450 [Gordonia metallireducens]
MTVTTESHVTSLPWSDQEFRDNPYPWYAGLRSESPVCQLADGTHLVLRHADIVKWAKDPCMSVADPDMGAWEAFAHTMLFKDPPEHAALRRRTNKWFTPKLIKQWAQHTADVVNETLDRAAPGDVIEAHLELAVRPTHVTMCRVLGFPEHDVKPVPEAMITAMDALVAEPHPDSDAVAARAFAYLEGRVAEMVAEKRRNPGNGLADELLAAQDRGELTERQVLQTLMLFFGSGGHNPGFTGAVGLRFFAERPDIFDTYRNQPEERSMIIEELIRLHPAEMSFQRITTADIVIGGVAIPAGSTVRFMIGSANRDPEVFERPDEFDHTRPLSTKHISFSLGPHACAGQMLSRVELETMFTTIAERYERIELVGEPVTYNTDRGRNYRELPIRLH